jgi:hypothetical protein
MGMRTTLGEGFGAELGGAGMESSFANFCESSTVRGNFWRAAPSDWPKAYTNAKRRRP